MYILILFQFIVKLLCVEYDFTSKYPIAAGSSFYYTMLLPKANISHSQFGCIPHAQLDV